MRLKKKLAFSLQSMAEIGSTARRVSSLEDMIQTKFFIVRQVAGTYREIAADEHTQVRAGDVVRVRLSVSDKDTVSAAVVTGSVN
jgi:polysaccharide export outer membrane protein